MASRFAYLVNRSRVLGVNASSQLGKSSNNNNQRVANNFIARSSSTASSDEPLRRRRRRVGGSRSPGDNNQKLVPDDPSINTIADNASAAFAPKDSQGNLLDAQEYLSLASLSPWVPCPDMVIKRVFEIADASANDVHVDLGCGDGRLNFAAVGGPYHVEKSWGVDVDLNILDKCNERLGKRFVPSIGFGGSNDRDKNASSEAERLEFLQGDLTRVIERQKNLYQLQFSNNDDGSLSTTTTTQENNSETPQEDWSKEDGITEKLTQSTLVTMYFVDDALKQIQPYLESTLGGRPNVRVITVGYEMKGWDASWVERVLGLTIFKYDMGDVSSDPLEWMVGEETEEENEGDTMLNSIKSNGSSKNEPPEMLNFDGDYSDVDESSELGQYLRQKREQDMEMLNKGLRIHHDEKLNDFAQFRSKPSMHPQDGGGGGALPSEFGEEWDADWDETEDPEELMREAHQLMAEARMGGRGKGMMAGLGVDKKKGPKAKKQASAKPAPIWQKPL